MSNSLAYMRDPHVVRLRYRIEHSRTITFRDNTPPLEWETDAFHMKLVDGIATFTMKKHYASERSAREAVEQYLLPWEIVETVRRGGTKLRFIFEESEVIDRDTSPGPRATVTMRPAPTGELRMVKKRYPEPPENFRVSEVVDVLWTLYEGYLQGRDRLLPMVYTFLSRLTYDTGGNKSKAAKRYRISENILTDLSKLSSASGTGVDARKWETSNPPPRALTNREVKWIEEALKLLIYSAGQYAADPNRELPKITKAHLPPL